MPTLTITANTSGVITALRGIASVIEQAEGSTKRLAGISSTLAGHYQSASASIREADRRAKELLKTTLGIAKAAKSSGGFSFGGGFGGNASAEFARARQETERAARASTTMASGFDRAAKSARIIAAQAQRSRVTSGGGGGGLVPFTGGGGSGGGGILDVRGTSRILETASKAGGRSFLSTLKTGLGAVGGPATALASGFLGALSGGISTITSVLSSAISGAFRIAQTGITAVIGAALVAGGFSVREAVASQPINNAFGNVTQSAGLGSGADVLGRLRGASQGTISDRQLQLNANQALFLGAAENTEQIELLISAGRRLGEAMGRNATEGFNDLAIGIGRQSRLILDNLGLIVRAEEATEKYAASIGVTSAELDDNQRKLAFQQAAYDAINVKLGQLGEEQDTAAKGLARLGASLSNFGAQLAGPLLGSIQDVANRWAEFLGGDLSPERVQQAISGAFSALRVGGGVFSDLGSGLKLALTQPSEEAFQILGIRFGAFVDVAKNNVSTLFDTALPRYLIAFEKMASGLNRFIVNGVLSAVESIEDRLGLSGISRSLGIFGARRRAVAQQTSNVESFGRSALNIDAQEQRLRETNSSRDRINASIRSEADRRVAELLGQLTGRDSSQSGFIGPTAQSVLGGSELRNILGFSNAIQEATAPVQRITEAKDDELFALEKVSGSYRDLTATQRESIRISEREAEARRRNAGELEAAGADLARAQAGFGAFETIGQQAGRLAQDLRRIPDQVAAIADDVAFARDDLGAVLRESVEAEREARQELERAIRDSARNFLRGGPVDGQNVASRAAQRRFQREERRAQANAINGAFASSSLTSFGGNFGGFGAQNIDRRGPGIDPRAIQAAAGLERLEGGGGVVEGATAALRAIQEENKAAIAEARNALADTLDAQRELLATTKEKEEAAAAIQIEITGAIARLNATMLDALARVQASEAEVARLKAQQVATQRAWRKK